MLELYDYFRSSASYRVRIVLSYKNLKYSKKEVHLVNNGGEQHAQAYKKVNPQGLIPSLVDLENNICLTQSLAIIEYLEEAYPEPSILPKDLVLKSQARALAYIVSSDTHPLNNLRVLNYLKDNFKVSEADRNKWYHHWLGLGFDSIEQQIQHYKHLGNFCLGEKFTLADVCLIPQVFNALRFELPMEKYPRIMQIYTQCLQLPYVDAAKPE